MIEIRPIREHETEAFLRLLSDVFELDIPRARSVFYTEPYFDLERKWALFDGNEMRCILTTTPLIFGWGRALGIAGVATPAKYRGRGYAQRLLEVVLEKGERDGENGALLFAHQETVYRRVGFQAIDDVIRAPLVTRSQTHDLMAQAEVRRIYEAWAMQDRARLIRDERRWRFWGFVHRPCEAFSGGYVCQEPLLIREALLPTPEDAWPAAAGAEWMGLASLTRDLQVPIGAARRELIYMGRNVPGVPQMFMTDQF